MKKLLYVLACTALHAVEEAQSARRLLLPAQQAPVIESTLLNRIQRYLGYLASPVSLPTVSIGWCEIKDDIRDYALLIAPLRELVENPHVDAIILRIDSPGGCIGDTQIIAEYIAAAKSQKPIIAFVSNLCASGAYWIASACSHIICPTGAEIGSIGAVWAASFNKDTSYIAFVSGDLKRPQPDKDYQLSQAYVQYAQALTDEFAQMFVQAIAQNRAIPVETITSWQAGTFTGSTSLKLGLVDQLGTEYDALEAAVQLAQQTYGVSYDKLAIVLPDGHAAKVYQL